MISGEKEDSAPNKLQPNQPRFSQPMKLHTPGADLV